jgi:CIC family chloride channel protein
MGTAFAGIVRSPLTSVIMIFEMTRDYTIIVPLMISNLIAFYVSYKLQKDPIYEALAHQDGVHLPSGGRARVSVRVARAMHPAAFALRTEMDCGAALQAAAADSAEAWPVMDGDELQGMIRRSDLEGAPPGLRLEKLLDGKMPHLHPDHSLGLALERMGSTGLGVLPVVNRADIRKLLGVVTLRDVLDAYGFKESE